MNSPMIGANTGPTFTLRRVLPFGVLVLLSALTPALPHNITPIASWWLGAFAVIAMSALGTAVAARLPNGHWWHTVAPLLVLPAIQMLRAADGYAQSGFTPLLFLPVLWFALYGPLRDVVIAVVASANLLLWPIFVLGAPNYPASSLRGSLLFIVVLAVSGLLISTLVRSTRSATEQLAESESRFRAAFDNAPVGMALTGIHGSESGYFLRVNSALCAMFGRTAAELTSRPVEVFTHPDDVAQTRAWFDTATDANVAHRVEKRYLHPSGRTIWAVVSFSVLRDQDGVPTHLITQLEDVGARRQADQALLDALDSERAATEQMREMEASRTAVMSNAAHDLRTPLTSAAGFTELLLDGSAGELGEMQRGLVETISRGLARLGSIVDELVTTAKKQVESVPDARVPFAVGPVLDGATEAMTILASLAGQTLTSDIELDGVRVIGESDRLDRALGNLIGNAVKFTPAGGTVRVEGRVRDCQVVITISDTGIGIPAGDHSKIFERYYRSEAANGRSIHGTGLGLAIVREIVHQHDGTVTVTSEPGRGSTFTLTLPVLIESDQPEVAISSRGRSSTRTG